MACEVFKIVNNISPNYINDLIKIKKTSMYDFRGERKADVSRVNTMYGLRSFRLEAARVWSSLPNEVRLAESYPQFRRRVRALDGLGCRCSLIKFINLLRDTTELRS